jgi:hypothetical protein
MSLFNHSPLPKWIFDLETLKFLLVNDAANAPNQYGTYQGSMSNHGMVYANLVAALQGRETYYATAEEALKTVEIIERIHQSINLQS